MARQSTKLLELKRWARRRGWSSWLRKGEGEEADERALLSGHWFNPERGEHAVKWIERYCKLVEGAWRGHDFRLLDWQWDLLMRLFGWVRWSKEWERYVRRFRWLYLEVPKKNGKSPMLAAIGAYLLFGDGCHSARIYSVATSKKQAQIVHGAAVDMVRASPELTSVSRIRMQDGYLVVECPKTGGKWSIAAADAKTADGVNGHCLADELHRWTDWEFWNTLRWMLAAQPEGLFAAITTAGADMQSICRTQYEKTLAVNEGRMQDDQFLGKIFAAGSKDDPHDQRTWFKANPSLGKTRSSILKLSDFRGDYHAATQDLTQWDEWKRLRLGVWKTAEAAWLSQVGGISAWDAGAPARKDRAERIDCHESFTLAGLRERGLACWAGFDGATHHDTTAFVLVFSDPSAEPVPADATAEQVAEQSEIVRIVPYYWLPEAEAMRLGAKVPYQFWADAGHIRLTSGDAVDYSQVKADILTICDGLKLQGIAFDPLFQSEQLTQEISAETGADRHEFRQVITQFSPPMKTLARLIAEKKVRHNGHPIFTWQLGHLACYEDCNGNQRPVRQKQGDCRTIDGPVAAIMGLGLMLDSQTADKPTWYDDDKNEVEFL